MSIPAVRPRSGGRPMPPMSSPWSFWSSSEPTRRSRRWRGHPGFGRARRRRPIPPASRPSRKVIPRSSPSTPLAVWGTAKGLPATHIAMSHRVSRGAGGRPPGGQPSGPDHGRHGERARAAHLAVPRDHRAARRNGGEEQPQLHVLLAIGCRHETSGPTPATPAQRLDRSSRGPPPSRVRIRSGRGPATSLSCDPESSLSIPGLSSRGTSADAQGKVTTP